MTKETETALNAYKHSGAVSWSAASSEAKKNLPAPPEPDQFQSAESYEEAKSSWVNRVLPVLARRQAAYQRAHN